MNISYQKFENATARLEEALALEKDDIVRDSVIQRFEFAIELAWRTAKKFMGSSSGSPKDIIREMAQSRYINVVELWLTAIDMRNLSSHTYNEELAEQVYAFAKIFVPELKNLLNTFKKK